jgi:apolipoprotein N-acyltransferase
LAFSQGEGAFLPLASLGGTPLLGFAVVLTGFGLASLVRQLRRRETRARRALIVTGLATVLPLVAGLATAPFVGTAPQDGTTTVALVQGNVPRLGLDFNAQRRAVLDNHVARTEQLAADVAAGRQPRPDFVIWPENSSDIDPLRNPDARAAVNRAADAIGVPLLVGAVLTPESARPTNTMIVWDPETGPGEQHDKRRLQPFGEYVPYRDFFRLFSPYVDQASNFAPGNSDGVVALGAVRVGIATCYEVIFDDLVRESVRAGAQLLAVPSNNATFGLSDMTYQQLAMSQVRAVEHGRAVLVAATTGVSAVIMPDGAIVERTGQFTADALVAEVPLRSELTLATRLGILPEVLLVLVAAGAVLIAATRRGRRNRSGSFTRPGWRRR